MSALLTADDIAKGRALAEAATGLPWVGDRHDGTVKYGVEGRDRALVLRVDHKNGASGFLGEDAEADEAYMLHACNTLPAALDHIGTVEGENERLRALVVTLAEACENAVDETAWCPACENHNHTDDCPVPGALG